VPPTNDTHSTQTYYLTPSHMRSLLLVNKCIAADTWLKWLQVAGHHGGPNPNGTWQSTSYHIYNDMVHWATTTLDGYPSHSDKIHYIQMVTSVYICGTTFCDPWQSTLLALSLLPSTYFWPTLLPSELSHLWHIIGSSTSALIYHVCTLSASLTLWFLSFSREAMELMENRDNGDS